MNFKTKEREGLKLDDWDDWDINPPEDTIDTFTFEFGDSDKVSE